MNGWHSEFTGLFIKRKDLEKTALKIIASAIDSYINEIIVYAYHAILVSKPFEYQLLIWAVLMIKEAIRKSISILSHGWEACTTCTYQLISMKAMIQIMDG